MLYIMLTKHFDANYSRAVVLLIRALFYIIYIMKQPQDQLASCLPFGYGSSSEYQLYDKSFTDLQKKFGVYFHLSEFLHSETALRMNLRTEIRESQFNCLCHLLDKVLYPARIAVGCPIHVNSGVRSHALNSAVGGVSNSLHLQGRAADIWCADMKKLWRTLEALPHTELIQYKSFIHVAL